MTALILAVFIVYIIFAFRYRFMPFGRIHRYIKDKKGFESLMVLLGSSLGVGNIVGVGVAIFIAGPGVLFWMLVSAFFSATTNFLEVYFSKKTVVPTPYGPISYITNKPMAILYTILMLVTSLFIGNMCQMNSICVALNGFPKWAIALVILFLFFLSTKKKDNILSILNFMMPILCLLYLAFSLFILGLNIKEIIPCVRLILNCAFHPEAYLGIPLYFVFNQGILFAIFSNEAGNGSSAMAFSANQMDSPRKLGVISSLGPIIDTAILCVLTGLVILTSPLYKAFGYLSYSPNTTIYILEIFKYYFGGFGTFLMTFLVILFSFATLISWFYYGVLGISYLGIPYWFYQFIYMLLAFFSVFFSLITLMDYTNYLNLSLLFINLFFLLKISFMKQE